MQGIRKKGRRPIYDDVLPLLEIPEVKDWNDSLQGKPSQKTSLYSFARYLRWRRSKGLVADPVLMLRMASESKVDNLRKQILPIRKYLHETYPRQYATAKRNDVWIRSFYGFHDIPLPKTKLKNKAADGNDVELPVTATTFIAMMKTVLNTVKLSPRDRSIMLTMFQSGMDDLTLTSRFNYSGYSQLANYFGTPDFEEWDSSKCPVLVHVFRSKGRGGRRYYTFLDIDAIETMKAWLLARRELTGKDIRLRPSTKPNVARQSDPIYIDIKGKELGAVSPFTVSEVFLRNGKRAGVNVVPDVKPAAYQGATIRYPFHSHECRDTIITLGSEKGVLNCGNFICGHQIDDLNYDKKAWDDPEMVRREYMEISRPLLNPISGLQQVIAEKAAELKTAGTIASLQEQLDSMAKRLDAMLPPAPAQGGGNA